MKRPHGGLQDSQNARAIVRVRLAELLGCLEGGEDLAPDLARDLAEYLRASLQTRSERVRAGIQLAIKGALSERARSIYAPREWAGVVAGVIRARTPRAFGLANEPDIRMIRRELKPLKMKGTLSACHVPTCAQVRATVGGR